MKRTIAITLTIASLSPAAFGQGAISGLNQATQYVTTFGPLAADPYNATTWYSGPLTLEVLFASAATAGDISALDAAAIQNQGAYNAAVLLSSDGFMVVSLTGGPASSIGTVSGSADTDFQFAGFPATIDLSTAFAPNTQGAFAFLFTTTVDGSSYEGVEGFMGNYGSAIEPFDVAPAIDALGTSQNLVLDPPIPEPGTLALAALGAALLLRFRRQQLVSVF